MFVILKGSDLVKDAKANRIHNMGHGANCWSTMGAGIAKQISVELPELYEADKRYGPDPEARLGRISYTQLRSGAWGYNLYTQFTPGPCASYEAVESALTLAVENVAERLVPEEMTLFGIPALGCGYGGLNFLGMVNSVKKVDAQLQQDYPGVDVVIVLYTFGNEFAAEVDYLKETGTPVFHDIKDILNV